MKEKRLDFLYRRPVVTGLIAFFFLAVLSSYLTYQRYLLFREQRDKELTSIANYTKEELQSVLRNSLSATKTLSFFITKFGPEKVKSDFNEIAKGIIENNKYIDAIELVEKGVIKHVYPLEGNETVIGYDIFKDSLRRKEALIPIQRKELYFAGPFKLKQGYVGIVGRLPVFIDNKFWGFSVVLIKLSTLIDATGLEKKNGSKYLFQLSKMNPDSKKEEFFLPDPEAFSGWDVVSVSIAEGDWKIYVKPAETGLFITPIPFGILCILLSALGGIFSWYTAKQPYHLQRLVNKQTRSLIHEKNLSDSIIKGLPGIFYVADTNGKLLSWNKDLETISGYRADEVKTMTTLDFVEPTQREFILTRRQKALSSGNKVSSEVIFVKKNKGKLLFYFTIMPIMYNNQLCLMGVGIDITEKKETETALLKRNEEIRERVKELRCLYRISEISNDREKSIESILQECVKLIPEAYKYPENTCVRISFDGKMFQSENFQESSLKQESRILTNNTSIGKAEVFFTGDGIEENPFLLEEQDMLNSITDILGNTAERKKAELAIAVSEEKYRYLFHNSPALIIIWDLETLKILEANEQAMKLYGYTAQEFVGMSVFHYRPVEDYIKIKSFAAQMLARDVKISREIWRHYKKNGELMYMDIASHKIDFNGRKAILSLAKDVTEQYKAEEELQRTYEDIRRLNAHLQTVREEERAWIAREIHDELGQQLTGLKMDISWLSKKLQTEDEFVSAKISEMLMLIDDTVKIVRRITSELRPGILDDLGLVAAIEWQSNEFQKRSGISCNYKLNIDEKIISKNIATAVFRVYQEALTNIMRHSEATEVKTELENNTKFLELTISDNGKGFDQATVKKKNTLGLVGMQERAIMFGGELKIKSKKGEGTVVKLVIPLTKLELKPEV